MKFTEVKWLGQGHRKQWEVKVGFTSSLPSQEPWFFIYTTPPSFQEKCLLTFWLYAQFKAEKHDVNFWDTHFISENLKMKLKIKQQSQTQALCSENVGPNLMLSDCHVARYLSLWNSVELFEREERMETSSGSLIV